MKFLALVAFFATSAFAQTHMDKICSTIVQVDGDRIKTSAPFFAGEFASYRIDGQYVVEKADVGVIGTTSEKIVSLKVVNDSLWVLTPSQLVKFNPPIEREAYRFNGQNIGMAVNGNMLLIAKRAGGLTAFDTTTNTVVWENALGGMEYGWPVAVTSEGKIGYAAMQSADEGGFTGIVSFDVATGKVLKKAPYHYAYGVIGIDVVAGMYKGNVILNNQGWIHLISKAQINSEKKIRPHWVAHQLPRDGEVNPHYMMLEGDFKIVGNELRGCGKYNTMENGDITIKGKLFTVKLP